MHIDLRHLLSGSVKTCRGGEDGLQREKGLSFDELNILNNACQNGIIDMARIKELMVKADREKYLKQHKYAIYMDNKGNWSTRLPKPGGGRIKKTYKSREKLEEVIIAHYKELESSSVVTVENAFHLWIEEKLQLDGTKKQTIDRYSTDFTRYFDNTNILKMNVSDVTEDMLKLFIRETIREKQLTNRQYKGLKTLINGIFKYAKDHHYTDISISSFFGDLSIPKTAFRKSVKKDKDDVFTEEELGKIREWIYGHQSMTNLGILLVMNTGLRLGELVALKWKDVDGDFLHVHRTQERYKGESGEYIFNVRDSGKTDAADRRVYLNKEAKDTLHRIRLKNPFGEWILEKKGNRMVSDSFDNTLYYICDRAGIKRRSMHKLRKAYATKLIDAGVSESVITAQMGHNDIQTTRQYYYRNNKTDDEVKEQLKCAIG